jgi:hypothetical protein
MNVKATVRAILLVIASTATTGSFGAQSCTTAQIDTLKKANVSAAVIQATCGVAPANPAGAQPGRALPELRSKAEAGDASSAFELGRRYEAGDGVLKDFVQAYAWYSRAFAKAGNPQYKSALDSIEKRMTAADIARAQRVASERTATARTSPATPAPAPRPKQCELVPKQKWTRTTTELDYIGFGKGRTEYQACSAAKADVRSDMREQSCAWHFDDKSVYRNVRSSPPSGDCVCEQIYDSLWDCEYEPVVQCEAEELDEEMVEQCE